MLHRGIRIPAVAFMACSALIATITSAAEAAREYTLSKQYGSVLRGAGGQRQIQSQ